MPKDERWVGARKSDKKNEEGSGAAQTSMRWANRSKKERKGRIEVTPGETGERWGKKGSGGGAWEPQEAREEGRRQSLEATIERADRLMVPGSKDGGRGPKWRPERKSQPSPPAHPQQCPQQPTPQQSKCTAQNGSKLYSRIGKTT